MKRLGIIAQDINSGIGVQTQEYARWLKPDKVLVTDLTVFHEQAGKSVKRYPERFAEYNTRVSNGVPSTDDIDWLTTDIDVILIVETPINHSLYLTARAKGVKTCLAANYELIDKFIYKEYPMPDELWMPTSWHWYEMLDKAKEWGCKLLEVPVPVNRELLPFKLRTQAKRFLHIAGHPTFEDRNGTEIVMAAIPFVKSDVEFIIRTQHELPKIDDPRVTMITKPAMNYWQSYDQGDVLLLPRRYGGLTLQLNEALSLGMPAIMTDVSPQNTFLNESWLTEADYQKTIVTRPTIDIFETSPEDLAKKIDHFANVSEQTFTSWSLEADMLARDLDWEYLLPAYQELLDA